MAPTDPAAPRSNDVPLWLRRGTLWAILVLTTIGFALIAYYLLPVWWAELVATWVGASNSWITGLALGFTPVIIGLAAIRGAWRLGRRPEAERPSIALRARPLLGVLAGVSIVVLALTVFIAAGVTDPLREARALWAHDAPGVLGATLVGALIAVIAILSYHVLRTRRQRSIAEQKLDLYQEPPQETGTAGAEDGKDP